MSGKRFLNEGRRDRAGCVLHDFGFVVRKNYWLFLVTIAFFLITVPFLTAGLPGDSIFNIELTHDQLKFRLIHDGYLSVVTAGAVVLGMVSGVALFRFMQDKNETTLFFSLGMTRTQLMKNRCLAGILMLFAGIAVPMFVSMGLNIRALGAYTALIRDTFYLTAGLSVTAIVAFLAAAAVSAVAGTTAEAVVYWCGVMSVPGGICYALNLLMNTLLWGNARGVRMYSETETVKPGLTEQFARLDPFTFFYKELKTHAQYMHPVGEDAIPSVEPGALIGWSIVAAALLLLTALFLRKRKAEIAGIAGTNRGFAEFMIAFTSFLVFALVFAFLYPFSAVMAVFFGAAAVAVVHLFWRRALFSRLGGIRKTAVSFAAGVAACFVVCAVFLTGGFGKVTRYLDSARAVEALVSYVGSPSWLYEPAAGSSTGRRYYVTGRIVFEDPDEIARVRELQRSFAELGKQPLALNEYSFAATVIPYDVVFEYRDADGSEHTWYYDRASFAQLEQLLTLEDSSAVREGVGRMLEGSLQSDATVWAGEAYRTGAVYLMNTWCSRSYALELTQEQRRELLDAIRADRENQSVWDLYFPAEQAQAVLMFSRNGEYDCQYYAFNLDNTFLYLTAKDENTLAWLEAYDLLGLVSAETEIESITLQYFDPYVGINDPAYPFGVYFMSYRSDDADAFMITKDFGLKTVISEPDRIAAYAPGLRNGYFMSRGGWLAAVKVAGTDGYIYMFLPSEYMPAETEG